MFFKLWGPHAFGMLQAQRYLNPALKLGVHLFHLQGFLVSW